ncbi:hypothetical protein QQ045_028596 [Rhodiola kirilowii]
MTQGSSLCKPFTHFYYITPAAAYVLSKKHCSTLEAKMMRIELVALAAVLVPATLLIESSQAQLCTTFHDTSCPNASTVVRSVIVEAQKRDVLAGGKFMRIHFHDCFVNGCDGSVLLDNADGIESGKDAALNAVSLEGWMTLKLR